MGVWLVIYAAAAAQAWLIAPVLWQRAVMPANRLLAGWLGLVGVDLAVRAWALTQTPETRFKPLLIVVGFPCLHASLFYLYVRCAGRGSGLRWRDLAHALGYLMSLLLICDALLMDAEQVPSALSAGYVGQRTLLFNIGLFAWSLSYIAAALVEIARQRRRLLSTQSDGDLDTLAWLNYTALWQCLIWAIALLLQLTHSRWLSPRLIYAAVAAWVLALGYRALMGAAERTLRSGRTPDLNDETAAEPASARTDPSEDDIGDHSNAFSAEASDIDPRFDDVAARLRQLMEQEHLYRQPALAIGQLARRAGYPEYLVSSVINQHFGLPYWDYVNRYRVEAARDCLQNPADPRTALDIAYDCGFTSKSTFNSAFKRLLGETPSQCRARANLGAQQRTSRE